MKMKLLFFIIFCAVSASGFAKTVIDSVGVKNVDGKRVVVFKVKPKDTYYSIGRKYGVKPKDIIAFNKAKKEGLTIGQVINVPTGQPFKKTVAAAKETWAQKKARLASEAAAAKAQQQSQTEAKSTSVFKTVSEKVTPPAQQTRADTTTTQYKVSAGETLYSISKRFNTTVENIQKTNNLTTTTLVPGQILLIKPAPVVAPPPPPAPPIQVVKVDSPVVKKDSTMVAKGPIIQPKDSAAERSFNAAKFGLYEKDEKGVATWIDDTSLDPNKKLVLHRTAPLGTVLKITNPMTNRTTFAKVVGRFSDNESTKDVLIVMTKNVADALGALDKRFRVNISYGSANE
jgi:LysM repeat protein